jgi:hypothetical protein
MPLYPFYTYPIGNMGLGFWLIRKDPRSDDQWLLVMCESNHKKKEIGFFASPHKAAYAVAQFQTGNPMWDSLPQVSPPLAQDVERSTLHDLNAWELHDKR